MLIRDQKLTRLVKAAEVISEREADLATPRRLNATPLDPAQVAPVVEYLLAPYEHGYWELRATWNSASPFSEFLLEKIGTLSEFEKDEASIPFLPTTIARKMPEETRDELLRVTSRLSAIAAVFRAIAKTKDGGEIPRIADSDEWIKRLDLKLLRSKFIEAAQIFEEKIYFDGLLVGISSSRLYRTKFGLVSYIESPRKAGALHIAATRHSDICALRDFYAALGVLKSPVIGRVFAPDEALFMPYFSWVSGVLPYIIQDSKISKAFAQALDYYEKDDFQHCISTLGLISEEYLQRIYTTLLREQISGGLTLGQTIDRLHKRIDDHFPVIKSTPKTLDAAFDQIKAIDASTSMESLKPTLREIVTLIQDDRNQYNKKIEEIQKAPVRRSPFPIRIGDCLNELLKWRNAASHNSRVPLGAHEADRTLYCLVSVISWWQEQLAMLDWSKTKLEVLETLLASAKQATQK